MFPWHQYLLAFILVLAGFFHIQKPKIFHSIIPNYLPVPKTLVLISGIVEMILGFMLVTTQGQIVAARLITIMMTIYLLVHWYMLKTPPKWYHWPKWLLWLILSLQFGLIYWSLQYF